MLVLDSDRSSGGQSIYSPLAERPSDPPGCDDQQSPRQGSASIVPRALRKLVVSRTSDTGGRKREPFGILDSGMSDVSSEYLPMNRS